MKPPVRRKGARRKTDKLPTGRSILQRMMDAGYGKAMAKGARRPTVKSAIAAVKELSLLKRESIATGQPVIVTVLVDLALDHFTTAAKAA